MITAKWAKQFKASHPDVKISLFSINHFIKSFGYSPKLRSAIRGLEAAAPLLYIGWKNGYTEEEVREILNGTTKTTKPEKRFVLSPFPGELTYLSKKIDLAASLREVKRGEANAYRPSK